MSLSCHRQVGWAKAAWENVAPTGCPALEHPSGITLSLPSVPNICGCPCPQVLAAVPAWLSRSQPQAVQGASRGCQVSVPGVWAGDFPSFQTLHQEAECGTWL